MTEVEREESEVEWYWHSKTGSWFQRDMVKHIENSNQLFVRMIYRWMRVTSCEERVFWGGCIKCVSLSWASEESKESQWCGRIWEFWQWHVQESSESGRDGL